MSYDPEKTVTNVSLYLSLTSLSSICSSYLGGYLLGIVGSNQKVFILSASLPTMTLVAGLVTSEFARPSVTTAAGHRSSICSEAKRNWVKVWQFIVLPTIYKPLLFIFLIVIAPGITDAMFYFRSDVLGFDSSTFALMNACSSIATIVGVWVYRIFFKGTPLRFYMICTTICYSLIQTSNLLLSQGKTEEWLSLSPRDFSILNTFAYATVNELHIMPLMVLAA